MNSEDDGRWWWVTCTAPLPARWFEALRWRFQQAALFGDDALNPWCQVTFGGPCTGPVTWVSRQIPRSCLHRWVSEKMPATASRGGAVRMQRSCFNSSARLARTSPAIWPFNEASHSITDFLRLSCLQQKMFHASADKVGRDKVPPSAQGTVKDHGTQITS